MFIEHGVKARSWPGSPGVFTVQINDALIRTSTGKGEHPSLPDPSCHSFQHAAYSTFPFDSSVKAEKESWSNHEKESHSLTCPAMGTHKQQTIISVKRSRTHCCIWLKRWQDTNLIIRNEYDKSLLRLGHEPLVPWSHFQLQEIFLPNHPWITQLKS